MKKLLLVGILLFPLSTLADDLTVKVDSVYDGDTFKITMNTMPAPLDKMSVRIFGIDAPEMGWRAKCQKEREKAIRSKQGLTNIIGSKMTVTLRDYQWDKFGGRILANGFASEVSISAQMIREGHAVPYYGRGKKHDWCR